MMQYIKRNWLFLIMVFLCIPLTLSATWVVDLFHFPLIISRVMAIIVYLPFAAFIGMKVWTDIRHFREAMVVSNGFYYGFAIYYGILTGYRFLTHMEVKENLYFSIVFFGAIALYMLLRDGRIKMESQAMTMNLVWIALFFVAYRLLYCTVGVRYLEFSPINVNLTSGAVAMLLPILGYNLTIDALSRKQRLWCWVAMAGSVTVVAVTGARALFWLMMIMLVVLLLTHIPAKQGWMRLGSAVLAGFLLVAALAVADVGRVRYSLCREIGITITSSSPSAPNTPSDDQLAAQEQVNASNQMRSELVAMGMEQIQLNPWFGTGDVMYVTMPREDFIAIQSSHNFLIEALICYGIFGLLMLAGLVISLIGEIGLFKKSGKGKWGIKIALFLTLFFYFAFGFVQPTVFNCIICLLFVMAMATGRATLRLSDTDA